MGGSLAPNFIGVVLASTAVIDTILGLIVIMRAYRHAYAWYFIGLVVGAVLWLYGDVLVLYGHSLSANNVGIMLFYAAPLFTPMFIWFFALTFPDGRKVPWQTTTFGIVYLIAALVIVAFNTGKLGDVVTGYPTNTLAPVFPGFVFYGLYLLCFFGIAFVTLFNNMVHTKGVDRSQVSYTFYGLMLSALLAMVTNVVLPAMDVRGLIWLGPVFTLSGVLAITLAIIRYRLFDIRFFVIRALAYLTVIFAITFIFITPFILFLNRLYNSQLSLGQMALGILLSVVFLYVVLYFHRIFDQLTNRIFFRGYVDSQYVLGRINNILVRTADLVELRERTAQVLRDVLHPESLRYVLFGDVQAAEERLAHKLEAYCSEHNTHVVDVDLLGAQDTDTARVMREANINLAIKLRTTHEDLGFMVLGHRRSGTLYTEQDKSLLTIVADGIAISLQNALRFQEIQRFNSTLQEEIDNATRRLKNSNQKLQELDETKDDFISMASHQLRTPLTSVKGYLSMVVEGDVGKLNTRQMKMLEQAFISSQRMAYLITDLLNISRLKTGKFIIDARPTNVSQMVQQEVEQLQTAAKAKGLTLSYLKPADFPMLMLDENKTRQVIMNFIDNAIYYTPSGGHIQVTLEERPASIELRVVDDGIGVPRSEQHHLFTKFYRATNARQTRPDGTGLGLFMAKKVIVAQGGSVIFSSKSGAGSTFGFTFPKAVVRVAIQPTDTKLKKTSARLAQTDAYRRTTAGH